MSAPKRSSVLCAPSNFKLVDPSLQLTDHTILTFTGERLSQPSNAQYASTCPVIHESLTITTNLRAVRVGYLDVLCSLLCPLTLPPNKKTKPL